MNTAFMLLIYIIFAIRRLKNNFGESLIETVSQLSEDSTGAININSAIDELTGMFANEFLKTFDEQVVLVLDDLHEITEYEWHKHFIELLLSEVPENLQIVITTRYQLELNLSALRAKREILEISAKELSFANEEIGTLARELYSKNYSEKDINYFAGFVGGWVTGIHLLLQSLERNTTVEKLEKGFLPENLFEYFADEIILNLDTEVRNFLLTTSHLETFDSNICNSVIGISNSAEILEYLSGKNIFIESLKEISEQNVSVVKYTYNQLFKKFLMNKSREVLGEKLNSVFMRIGDYYSATGNIEDAIKYYLKAGNYDSSIELLIKYFQDILESSRFESLWEIVNSFGKERIEKNKHLLYFMCLLSKFYKGNLDESVEFIDKAISKADEESDDRDFMITCLITKSEILVNRGAGKIEQAFAILTDLESSQASEFQRAKILYFLGNYHFNISRFKDAKNYLEKALEICRKNDLTSLEPDIYNLLGNIYILTGEFVLSNHYYELTYNKTPGLFKKMVALANLTILHSRTGKFSKSREYFEKTKVLAKLFDTPIFNLVLRMTEYTLLFETGDYNSAFILAKEISESALKLNSGNYIYLSNRFLGECSYYLENAKTAIEYFMLSGVYVDKSNKGDEMQLSLLIAASELSLNSTPELETELLRIYSYLDTIESNYVKASAGFYLAKFYRLSGNTATALTYLENSLLLASDKEYYSFLQREYLFSRELFDIALQNNICRKLIHEIYNNISGILDIEWISENYRRELASKVRKQYDIKMKAFGSLEFTVKNRPIEEIKWKRKKRKLILCYLLIGPNRQISKDKIIDIFYTDSSPENADNLFHQAVSNIRAALKVDQSDSTGANSKSGKSSSQYILYEGKILKMNPDFSYYSDIAEFDSFLEQAISKEDDSVRTSLLKSAVSLYNGEVLEGFYEPWCESLRNEYRNKYIKSLEQLIMLLSEHGKEDDIDKYCRKLLAADNLNELAYEIQIGTLVKLGNNAAAKERYQQMFETYEKELGEKPPDKLLAGLKHLKIT